MPPPEVKGEVKRHEMYPSPMDPTLASNTTQLVSELNRSRVALRCCSDELPSMRADDRPREARCGSRAADTRSSMLVHCENTTL